MKKQEGGDDGGDGAGGRKDGGEPARPENGSPQPRGSHARALALSSGVVVICFLLHILILFLVQPLKVLHLSKLNAYAVATIPLGMGLVFFRDAIINFRRLESRSPVHLVSFMLAIVFGGLSIQGFLGFLIYLVRHPPAL
jgi:hypothetical protein